MSKKIYRILTASIIALSLVIMPGIATAEEASSGSEASRAGGIALDLLVGRPTLVLATISGAIFYTASLPVTLVSGAEREARDRFVKTPRDMLVSPLGG